MIYFYLLEIPNIAYFYATQSNSDLLFINQTSCVRTGLCWKITRTQLYTPIAINLFLPINTWPEND